DRAVATHLCGSCVHKSSEVYALRWAMAGPATAWSDAAGQAPDARCAPACCARYPVRHAQGAAPAPPGRDPDPRRAAHRASRACTFRPQGRRPRPQNCCAPSCDAKDRGGYSIGLPVVPAVPAIAGTFPASATLRRSLRLVQRDWESVAEPRVRQTNLHCHRQVIGYRMGQHIDTLERQARAQQDMVQAALRAPAGKGCGDLRCLQAKVSQGRVFQQIGGMGVHVAHQHLVTVAANQLSDIGQLTAPGTTAQREMHDHHHQGIFALAELEQNCATPRLARQRMILKPWRLQAAEYAGAVLGEAAKGAVELLIPVAKGTQLGQMLYLIDITRTQAAPIGFLQGHQIVIAEQLTDTLQIVGTPSMGQKMLPAAGQVVVVTLGADPHLDVETEQPQPAIAR